MNSSCKNNAKISLKNVTHSFKEQGHPKLEVLIDISFKIPQGKITGLIGPSGSGKTTLFNIIAGITKPDKGEIYIDGKKVTGRPGPCGYMFQDPLLFPWRKTLDNISLGYELNNFPRKEARLKAYKLLEKFKLSEYAGYYPSKLSGGMRQRIALLRTIAFNSKILLLDEPFGSLDAITRKGLHYYLFEIWKKYRLTILFTTHDIKEAIFLSDKIYVLKNKPAKITKCLKVDLPRPRKTTDITSPRFVRLEKKLLEGLEGKR